MSDFAPTAEQDAAVALFEEGRDLAIVAGAGTGKTSTLVLLAEAAARVGRRGQYLAFNKAIVSDAGAKMPGNVPCSTAHSLAFRAVGKQYQHRLRSGRMKSMEIARRLHVDPLTIRTEVQYKPLSAGYLASLAMRAITNFCQSADLEPSVDHVPYVDGIDLPTEDGRRTYANNRVVARHLSPALKRAWADLSNPTGQLPFKHEHYLKIWHLSEPRIDADFILFDEAQDANPVMLAIVAAQRHAQLVFVGDPQQQIYGFTGAVNALDRVAEMGGARTFLTQSFRFGPAVAAVANGLLGRLAADFRLVGTPTLASVVAPVLEPDAVLCRTNAESVKRLLRALEADRKPHLVGGGAEVISFCRAATSLKEEGWTSHPELACFSSWGEVQDYVEHDEQGVELRLLVKLVDEFGADAITEALEATADERDADLVISTAHKAKGREWRSVQLAGDFPVPKDGKPDVGADELRLLYVACTRARLELDLTMVPHLVAPPAPPEIALPSFYVEDEEGPAALVGTPGLRACPGCGSTAFTRESGIIGVHRCAGAGVGA